MRQAVARELRSDEMIINMGPQHPSTHGVLRLELKADGEIVEEAIPHIGYLHRDFEKHAEKLPYPQIIPYTDRMDYIAAMNNELGFCLAVEALFERGGKPIEIPEKGQYIRVIVAELNRIASHLLAFGTYGMDIGAFTPFLYAFRDREQVLGLFEEVSGARLLYNYIRIGGVARDLTPDFHHKTRRFLDYFEPQIDTYNDLLSKNKVFLERTRGVAVMSAEQAISYGWTGPNLRGSGVKWDLRKDEPYGIYDRFEFDVPVGETGDCWDRYFVRMEEFRQSVRIVRQALHQMESSGLLQSDEIMGKVRGTIRPPAGVVYSRTEAPRGDLGFYIVCDGTEYPQRLKVRSPCFTALSAMQELSRGLMVADMIAIIGSIDIVMGEVDR
ncbi:NADH-quinone oxidoreductase subunit D [Candidatus Poribacteria bacterium]|nr:NADH-quinone oxidoreductase subunit D [Candidatus Poribacteria bacterium]